MNQITFHSQQRNADVFLWHPVISAILKGLVLLLFVTSCSEKNSEQRESPKNLYEVNAPSQLVVRSEPSKSGQKIVSLPDKTRIEVESIENGWARIIWEDYKGYVNADYIQPVMTDMVSEVSKSSVSMSRSMSASENLGDYGFKYLPILVLVLFIIAVVLLVRDEDSIIPWCVMAILSICEIVYMKCTPVSMNNYWFLEPLEVGWIWTIIGYVIMLGLVAGQGIMMVIWVRSTSSGWFNGLLTLGISFLAGIGVLILLSTYEKVELTHVLMGLAVVMCLVGLVYYANRNWSEIWYISLIDMIIVTAYICLIISLLSHIIIGVIGVIAVMIFTTKRGERRWFDAVDVYDNKIRLKECDNPTIAHDRFGKMYELCPNGKWRRC